MISALIANEVWLLSCRYKLNIWDVGGQKTLRPYWRNYYEKTDGLIWVIDSADLARLEDTKKELHSLLQEERLFGATLLILANKQDIPAALSLEEIQQVQHTGTCRIRVLAVQTADCVHYSSGTWPAGALMLDCNRTADCCPRCRRHAWCVFSGACCCHHPAEIIADLQSLVVI